MPKANNPVKLMRPISAGILKSRSFRAAQLTGHVRAIEVTLDYLYLNSIAFPVHRGTLSRNADGWCIEIGCGKSPQLDLQTRPDDDGSELDWLAGIEPWLYAEMLPLPASEPHELVGGSYSFPQTPDDEPAEWDRGIGWLFFCIYLHEHDLVYPVTISFIETQSEKYRVRIIGSYPANNTQYELRVETWLEWEAPVRP